ncbi:MAG: hypothetical protein FWD64_00540 [Acidobacteriaceae bacterium]|nr:hypothetical protein [Acidobacteriaceae bacterium]
MKKSLLILVGLVALSAVAFAQNPVVTGTTVYAKNCTGAAGTDPCTVQGSTLLVASKIEGITLTLPNEIDFTLIKGALNKGTQPLTAATTWDLSSYTDVTSIVVDAWFETNDAMTATDGSGATILATDMVGQIANAGPQLAFSATNTPYNSNLAGYAAVLPMYSVPPTANSSDNGTSGWFSVDMNLFVDTTVNNPIALAPGAVYTGVVYVTAAAI